MDLKLFLEMQKCLDDYIETNNADKWCDMTTTRRKQMMLVDVILAAVSELGEMANELKGDGFKFWSNKPKSDNEVILEELVDVYHFIFSITNRLGFSADDIIRKYIAKNEVNYTRQKEGY